MAPQHGCLGKRIAGLEPRTIRSSGAGFGALLAAPFRSHSGHFVSRRKIGASHRPGCQSDGLSQRASLVVPPPRSDRPEIVFSGNLEYAPNIAAVRFFHREVWPALQSRWPGVRWKILSKNAGSFRDLPERDPSIEITGFVADAVAVIAQSRVAVVPLFAGSGTRIKILEAWAAGTPVVSTTLGAQGLEYRDREHLVLADNAESFTAAVSELFALPVNRERIGAAGRRLYEEQYTWPTVWKALAAVVDE